MTLFDPLALIIIVIAFAGLFGGVVNYYLAAADDVPPPNMRRSMVVGLAAASLMPLFLNMTSSNLLGEIRAGDDSKLLVLLGFCLIASISSTSFIRTMSDRVLKEAREARKEAKEAKAVVSEVQQAMEPIIAKETESERAPLLESTRDSQDPRVMILRALRAGRWAFRTESGVAKETQLEPDETARILLDLQTDGLVARSVGKNGPRWFITADGLAHIGG